MHYTFEVYAWTLRQGEEGGYYWDQIHAGEDMEEAMSCMKRLKKKGVKQLKLEWR